MGDNTCICVDSLSLLPGVEHFWVKLNVGVWLVSTRTEHITLTLLRLVSSSSLCGVFSISCFRLVSFLQVSLSSRLFSSNGCISWVFAELLFKLRKFVGLSSSSALLVFVITTDVETFSIAERLLVLALSQFLLHFILLDLL